MPEPSTTGSVVLDIGGRIGAAVVITDAALAGAEIEFRPEDGPWTGAHVAVLERRVQGGPIFAAVVPSLPQGAYLMRVRTDTDPAAVQRIVVQGGNVITYNWGSISPY